MTKKYLYKWSTSSATRKIKIRTTLRVHLSPVIRLRSKNKMTVNAGKDMKTEDPHSHWSNCKVEQPHWKSVSQILRKLKTDLQNDPAIPFLGLCPQDSSSYSSDTYLAMFLCSSICVLCILMWDYIWTRSLEGKGCLFMESVCKPSLTLCSWFCGLLCRSFVL